MSPSIASSAVLSPSLVVLVVPFEHRRADVIAHKRGTALGDLEDKLLGCGPLLESGDISEPDERQGRLSVDARFLQLGSEIRTLFCAHSLHETKKTVLPYYV